jgi:arylsulfatase A-like enzyme
MKPTLTSIALIAPILFGSQTTRAQTTADVIVYGSTPGGFCAAIAAAREGASVVLLEPTAHVGGMNTGGLSFSDSDQMHRDKLMGLFHEWHLRIQNDYASRGVKLPYDVNVKDQAKWTYEPHVASRVTHAMLAEAGVKVVTGRTLRSVIKAGPRIASIDTSMGTYAARVFIDGSYEGDLMAAAGVSWTIGREGRAEFGETLAGKQRSKKRMNINGFDAEGKPLPLITGTDVGPEDEGDDRIMVYSFRLPLTNVPANKVPIPAPAHYDPARFEVMRRFLKSGGSPNMVGFDRYDIPGGKVDGNNGIGKQFSFGLIGGARAWATADQNERAAIFEEHRQYTLEFLHFLATDPAFPAKPREDIQQWGLCKDEFADTGHWPPQLYVRESRRMKGTYVLSQKDILDSPTQPDPIMVASFPIDSHDCQRIAHPGGGVENEGTIFPVRQPNRVGHPYQVPYRSILPRAAECENLLVPVALSATHVAMSSLRIEATWMLIGQSAGIAAALAADRNIAVQDVPHADLRPRLLAQKQELELPEAFRAKVDRARPNIVVILADDLGYGDVGCNNPERGKVPTPNIDRLASQGMRFTDGHSSSGVCSPSRYTLLTGRYHWRTRLQSGIVGVFGDPLIAPGRMTIGTLAKRQGHRTACVGKWHLGWDWPITQEQRPLLAPSTNREGEASTAERKEAAARAVASEEQIAAWRDIFSRPIAGGPTTRGFDHSFGTDVPNWPPFCFIENDRTIGVPSEFLPRASLRTNQASIQGPALKDWRLEGILPALGDRAVEFINESAREKVPFLLYMPLTSPHTPLAVGPEWKDRSRLNLYADFVMETDAVVGRVLEALEKTGAADNTLVIFTSDNGCAPYIGVKDLERMGHDPSGPLRGYKADAWEGGHRVPFLARWPGVVEPGRVCGQFVHQADLLRTFAEVFGVTLPDTAGEDSVSLMPLLRGEDGPVRENGVSASAGGTPAVRRGPWKYIPAPGSGGWGTGGDQSQPVQLYNLADDIGESKNLAAAMPGKVAEMKALLEQLITDGRSTPGARQTNDVDVTRFPTRRAAASRKPAKAA